MNVLVVTNPFKSHEVGHRITDPEEMQAILGGEHAHHVVRADHDIVLAGEPATTSDEA